MTTPRATFSPGALLEGFGPCGDPPEATVEAPEEMALPVGAILTDLQHQDELTQVIGFVPATPQEVRNELSARTDLELLYAEDEIIESELLVTDGDHRTFIKARASCDAGSDLVAVVAREVDPGGLPTPSGSPG